MTAEQFWALVRRDDQDACWLWTRATRNGYGVVWSTELKHHWGAHRLAYRLWHGEIPEGALVMHSCDTPPCCNPRHLRLGSDASNRADSARKKRHARGDTHGRRKLTSADVGLILASRALTNRALARRFGVSESAVSMIRNGKRWQGL